MMRCDTLREDLKAYLDGEMPLAQRLAVRRHLAGCQACRQEAETMAEIANQLRTADDGGMTAALRARILDEVGPSADGAPEVETPRASPVWRRPLTLWAAAATVAGVWFVAYGMLPAAREFSAPGGLRLAAKAQQERMAAGGPGGGAAAAQARSPAPLMGPPGPSEQSAYPASRAYDMARSTGTTRAMPGMAPFGSTAGAAAPALPPATRYVRKEASLTVDVEGVEAKADAVERMVKEAGGFVERNELTTGAEGLRAAALSLRTPVSQFEPLLQRIAQLGAVTAKNVTGQDITEQVSDEEQATQALADSVRQAEAKVRTRVRGSADAASAYALRASTVELAQARGRLALVRKLAALASITVELHEKPRTHMNGGGFLEEMGDTGRSAVNSFLAAARAPVLLLIWVLAYSPLWVPLAVAYRYAARAQRRRTASREAREWQTRRAPDATQG